MKLPVRIDLTDKVAVVTGGTGVLCSGFCRALAVCGAKVAILGRSREKLDSLEEEIAREGGVVRGFSVDVLDKEGLQRVHEEILECFGPCDILINGAGGNRPAATADDEYFSVDTLRDPEKKSFFDLSREAIDEVFSLNIQGTILPTQVFAVDMAEREKGCIINISSMNAFTPLTRIPAYSAAKSGVSNLTEWLAVHFAKSGIRCNAIAPGFFLTTQNASLLMQPDGEPTARAGKILAATPMGRFGKPEELIGALLFLVDDSCSGFVNGVVLPVDGGFNAYSGV